MVWLVLSGLGLLGGAWLLAREGAQRSTRTLPGTVAATPAVGAAPPDLPPPVARLLEQLLDRLARNDATPVGARYDEEGPTVKRLTFFFHTGFRAGRADEILTPSYRADRLVVRVVNQVMDAAAVGELPDAGWIFDVEWLKQSWPLIAGGRADVATLRRALKLAAALDGDVIFTQQGSPEDVALVVEMLAWLRQNVAVGAGDESGPELQRFVDQLTERLRARGVPPVGSVEVEWRDVFFKFKDDVASSIVVLAEYLPTGTVDLDGKFYRFKVRGVRYPRTDVGATVGKMDVVPDPKTGRTTRCDTSIPWWGKVAHFAVEAAATVFTGPAGAKLADATMNSIQDATAKLDGRALKKWLNEAPNREVMVWGIAHAKEYVDRAWKKTDGDWPVRRAALESLEVTPATFAVDRGDQIAATLKIMLLAAFAGGIDWPFTRHVTEAILLQVYPGGIAPLVPIIEDRGHRGKQRPSKKKLATAGGPYVLETLNLLAATMASGTARVGRRGGGGGHGGRGGFGGRGWGGPRGWSGWGWWGWDPELVIAEVVDDGTYGTLDDDADVGAVAPLVDCVARGAAFARAADIMARDDDPYGVRCPTCGGPMIERCKCNLCDGRCANGHEWHYGPKRPFGAGPGVPHAGPSNHGPGPCCAPTRLLVPWSDTAVGASQELPDWLRRRRDELSALLDRSDASAAGVEYNPADPDAPWGRSLTFLFHTKFRADRAADLLPPWIKPAPKAPVVVHVRTRVIDEVAVGQVVGTGQETPWTCGPAALRAVLAHYGIDVAEPELSLAAATAPALGARPEGMVAAAARYGARGDAFIMNSVGELADLLALGVPPIIIVDSWTRPGKVGHYVVVTEIDPERGLATIMDPHNESHWRTLTLRELDERWWARRKGADGAAKIVRRVAVIVRPGAGQAAVAAAASPLVRPAKEGGA